MSASAQHTVDLLLLAAVSSPVEIIISKAGTQPTATNGNGAVAASAKYLKLEDRSYFAVSALLQVLELLVDYLRIIANLSLLTTDVMGRTIEFLKVRLLHNKQTRLSRLTVPH